MILIIDNYDSFTHNLFQYLSELSSEEVRVVRNDRLDLAGVETLKPSAIVISPGPGRPEDAGISVAVVRSFAGRVPILGVCLGHQAIVAAFGGRIVAAKRIVHGKAEPVSVDGRGVFRAIASPSVFTRYHSLAAEEESLPGVLEVSARSEDGEIMGVRHREYVVEGVQFHPESIASEDGKKLLANFLNYRREPFVYRETLSQVVARQDLSRDGARRFMEELTEGNLSTAQIAALLAALSTKGVCPDEIAGCAEVLQRKRTPVAVDTPVLDTCGTGGDGRGTFNVSSLAALVAAAAGVTVAKHGNRAVSSKSGSADFYRELGINIEISPSQAQAMLRDNGFAFLYAPTYHKAMRFAAPARKELGIKTLMNLLGPLANPAGAAYQLIGVYDSTLCPLVARAAHLLGRRGVMVVHGQDGIDEVSVAAPTRVFMIGPHGEEADVRITPEQFGISGHRSEDIAGGTAAENAAEAWAVLRGAGRAAVRDVVLLNAAAALFVAGRASGFEEGLVLAREALSSGAALQQLERTIRLSKAEPVGVPA